jgi:hypothetical protein
MTVMVPWAPAAFAGPIKIIKEERAQMLEATVADVSRVLSLWGVGAHESIKNDRKSQSAPHW